MSVVAKFVVEEKAENRNGSTRVILNPVIGGSEENEKFWKYTPAGKIEMYIDNQAASEQFEVGKEYYVEFSSDKEAHSIDTDCERILTVENLLKVLAKNNEQLHDAVIKQEQAKESNCPVSIEESVRNCGIESGEALMLVKLIRYLKGEIELDQVV